MYIVDKNKIIKTDAYHVKENDRICSINGTMSPKISHIFAQKKSLEQF